MELEWLEDKEGLAQNSVDLVEFQKNIERNFINKNLDKTYLEFIKNNEVTIEQLVFLRKFCEYGKRGN